VLVVADMWTAHWQALNGDGPAAPDEWRAHVRALLELPHVQMIRIPDSFAGASDDERAELARCADRDQRLALAMRTAGPRREITQVLSGGPQLLRRYDDGLLSAQAHTVVTAAMDARRLGYEGVLPAGVLRQAAEGYLDDRVVDGTWFDTALAEATEQHHGIAVLTPTRRQPGLGLADGYVLHDFLDHHTRTVRARERPPASLWTALADHPATVEDLTRLAGEAQRRGLYRLANQFAAPAAESGSVGAMWVLAELCEFRGATARAETWLRRAGDLDASPLSSELWYELIDGPGESTLRPLAEAGDRDAMRRLVNRLRSLLRAEEALPWARRLADTGDLDTALLLADCLHDTGHVDEEEALLRKHADAGSLRAMAELVLLLDGQGRESFVWVQKLADAGDPLAFGRVITRLERQGREREAEDLLRGRAEDGEADSMWQLAEWLVDRDQIDEAVGWYRRSVEASTIGMKYLVDKLAKLGRIEDAEAPLRSQVRDGSAGAGKHLANLLERLERVDEADSVLRVLLEEATWSPQPRPTEPYDLRLLIELLIRTGRTAEAHQLRTYGIEPGGATAAPWELDPR